MENKTISKLVTRIMAILNITEESKIQNFFDKQKKALEREVKYLTKNIETVRDGKVDALGEVQEQIDDALVRVEDAYTNVKLENVTTNETSNKFAEQYWENIEKAEKFVFDLKAAYESLEESYDEQTENLERQLVETKRRIERIS